MYKHKQYISKQYTKKKLTHNFTDKKPARYW